MHVSQRGILVKRMVKNRQIILAGILIIALLSSTGTVFARGNSPVTATGSGTISGTDTPDDGQVGPESPVFGLKIAMENLDESFTFNDTERTEKQVDHARTRIEEVRRELQRDQARYAEKALELYSQKLDQAEMSLLCFHSGAPGLLHVQEQIARHQTLLEDLLSRYPDSTGLARAYSNNKALEQKFGEKTQMRFERVAEKENKTVLRAVKPETGKQDNGGGNDSASAGSAGQGRNEMQDHEQDKNDDILVTSNVVPSEPDIGKDSSKDQEKNGHGQGRAGSG